MCSRVQMLKVSFCSTVCTFACLIALRFPSWQVSKVVFVHNLKVYKGVGLYPHEL